MAKHDLSGNHEDAAGSLCIEGVDGCCTLCCVAMTACDSCDGIGYHKAGCAESDEAYRIRYANCERDGYCVNEDGDELRFATEEAAQSKIDSWRQPGIKIGFVRNSFSVERV